MTEILKIKCNDGVIVEVEKQFAIKSQLISNLTSDADPEIVSENEIPLDSIDSKTFKKVMEYCEHHKDDNCSEIEIMVEDEREPWDTKFLESLKSIDENENENENIDNINLLEVALAADYLNIPRLFNLVCRYIASDIRGTKVDYIRKYFHIPLNVDDENEETVEIQ